VAENAGMAEGAEARVAAAALPPLERLLLRVETGHAPNPPISPMRSTT
jgi:hypothetical protein